MKLVPMEDDTRQRLLDAAEMLFADASLRAIAARAKTTNLTAVNCRFGSKGALI